MSQLKQSAEQIPQQHQNNQVQIVQKKKSTHKARQRPIQAKQKRIKSKQHPIQAKQKPISKSQGNTQNLPLQMQTNMEAMGGVDLSDVKVHRNSGEPQKVGALAYAQGSDIHLGPGQEKHLGHEAWHTVQQKQGRVQPVLQAKGLSMNDDPQLEKEADVMGTKATQVVTPISTTTNSGAYTTSNSPIQQKKNKKKNKKNAEQDFDGLLKVAGTDKNTWTASFRTYSFLGLEIGNKVHQELANRLDIAQAYLQQRFSDLSDKKIAKEIGLYKLVGSRKPTNAVNGNDISYHSFGLAIDVNVKGNPYLGRGIKEKIPDNTPKDKIEEAQREVDKKNKNNRQEVAIILDQIYYFMRGKHFNIHDRPAAGKEEAYRALLSDVSNAFSEYFKMRDDPEAIRAFLTSQKSARMDTTHTDQHCEYIGNDLQESPPTSDIQVTDTEVQEVLTQIDLHYNNSNLMHDMRYGKPKDISKEYKAYLDMQNNPAAVRTYLEQQKQAQIDATNNPSHPDYIPGSTASSIFSLTDQITEEDVQAELSKISQEVREVYQVRDYTEGFIDLSEPIVTALVQKAGLVWGAGNGNISKDIMHFAYKKGTINEQVRKQYKALKKQKKDK